MGRVGLASLMLAAVLSVAGCASDGSKPLPSDRGMARVSGDPVMMDPLPETGRAPTPAPKPEPKAAAKPAPAPAPAPAPVAMAGNTSCMAYPTGNRSTSAIEVCQIMPAEVRAGQPYDYEICVQNLTNTTLQNVTVSAESFKNLAIVSSTPAATGGAGGSHVWNIGDLAAGEKRCIKVQGRADQVGVSSACVTATYNNLLCAATNVVQPALQITKTATPEVLLCDLIVYTIEVRNTGTGLAEAVKVRDNLPAGLTTTDGKTQLELDAGNLGAGQSKTMTIQVKPSKTGRFENNATATANGGLTATSNSVATVVKQPVLTLDAECGGTIELGRSTTAKFTVRNTGDSPCTGTVVSASLPSGATFTSADNGGTSAGGNVTWNIGTLGANESRTVSVTVGTSGAGELKFDATANCNCAQQVADSCSVNSVGRPDIGTLFTDTDGVIIVGNNHVYTYEVENQGQVNLTNVTVTVNLPAEVDFVSATVAPSKVEGKKLTFSLGSLAARAKSGFQMTTKGNKSGQYLLISETTATEISVPVRDDETTYFVDR